MATHTKFDAPADPRVGHNPSEQPAPFFRIAQKVGEPRLGVIRIGVSTDAFPRRVSTLILVMVTDVTTSTYGQHLTLRAAVPHGTTSLDSPRLIGEFLTSLVARLGMRVLNGPHVATEEGEAEKYGHSGVVILFESHAAIHTYPARSQFFLDVFSCKPFAVDDVLEVCEEFFGATSILERQLADRGIHWRGLARDHHFVIDREGPFRSSGARGAV